MENLDGTTLEGGWKYLCSAVMLQAVQSVRGMRLRGPTACAPDRPRRAPSSEIAEAWDWIGSDQGEITFADCCEALGVDVERARRILIAGPQAEYN